MFRTSNSQLSYNKKLFVYVIKNYRYSVYNAQNDETFQNYKQRLILPPVKGLEFTHNVKPHLIYANFSTNKGKKTQKVV